MRSYREVRKGIYSEIELQRQQKIAFMCKKCEFYVNEKCVESKCVKEVRRSVISNGDSKGKNIIVKTGRVQSKN